MEKLYKKLETYSQTDFYPFHMPGHKRNLSLLNSGFCFEKDITEIDGFDNLHHSENLLKDAQERISVLYGSIESFYSINGSTAALLAAVSASVKKGGKILMARNCHKAVYHGLYLRNLNPVYIYPQTEKVFGINGGILPSKVERCLEEHKDIEAVLITSPTYDGIVSDVKAIAEIAHKYEIPLIVDEAHGAHLRFSDYFPISAVDMGADIVVQSLHKTLPSMTQTAVLHRCSNRVNRNLLKRFLGIYQSSSPSYILMASMDACVDKLSKSGEKMFITFTEELKEVRKRLSECKHIRLISPESDEELGIYDFDRSKLLFSTRGTSITGKIIYKLLLEKYHLQMEMEAEDYVLAMTTVGDTKEGLERLCKAIEEIDQQVKLIDEDKNYAQILPLNQMMSLSDAMESETISCLLEESVGKISAEFVYLYPPGIPIIVPGEQITGQFVRNVRRYMEQGLDLLGLNDYTNETIYVVKE